MAGGRPGQLPLRVWSRRYVLRSAWQELNLSHPHNIVLDLWTRSGPARRAGRRMGDLGRVGARLAALPRGDGDGDRAVAARACSAGLAATRCPRSHRQFALPGRSDGVVHADAGDAAGFGNSRRSARCRECRDRRSTLLLEANASQHPVTFSSSTWHGERGSAHTRYRRRRLHRLTSVRVGCCRRP